jgi:hypothetical protein
MFPRALVRLSVVETGQFQCGASIAMPLRIFLGGLTQCANRKTSHRDASQTPPPWMEGTPGRRGEAPLQHGDQPCRRPGKDFSRHAANEVCLAGKTLVQNVEG